MKNWSYPPLFTSRSSALDRQHVALFLRERLVGGLLLDRLLERRDQRVGPVRSFEGQQLVGGLPVVGVEPGVGHGITSSSAPRSMHWLSRDRASSRLGALACVSAHSDARSRGLGGGRGGGACPSASATAARSRTSRLRQVDVLRGQPALLRGAVPSRPAAVGARSATCHQSDAAGSEEGAQAEPAALGRNGCVGSFRSHVVPERRFRRAGSRRAPP